MMNFIEKLWRKLKPLLLDLLNKLWPILIQVAKEVIEEEIRKSGGTMPDKQSLLFKMRFELARRGIDVSDKKLNEALGLAVAFAMNQKNGDGDDGARSS
jgi:hypothetical protein